MEFTLLEVGIVHGEQKLTSVKSYFEVTILEDFAVGVGIGLSCDCMVCWGGDPDQSDTTRTGQDLKKQASLTTYLLTKNLHGSQVSQTHRF